MMCVPNPRVHRSSGRHSKAAFPTGAVEPRVEIFLSPQNTNDGFSFEDMVDLSCYVGKPTLWIRTKSDTN